MALEFNHIRISLAAENNVIRLNSMVCVEDVDTGEKFSFNIVVPDEMDSQGKKLPVSSPLGNILLGKKVGTIVNWIAPSRLRRFKIRLIS